MVFCAVVGFSAFLFVPASMCFNSASLLRSTKVSQSIMEVSHRSADFQAVYDEAVALFKEVLNIPEGYHVLFLGGGASMTGKEHLERADFIIARQKQEAEQAKAEKEA